MQDQPTSRGPEHEAWTVVRKAVEYAIDTDGLDSRHRGDLAWLHGWVGEHLGDESVRPPDPQQEANEEHWERQRRRYARAAEPGGTRELGLSRQSYTALVQAGLATVTAVVAAAEEGRLLQVHKIGPKRALEILDALDAHDAWAQDRP